MVPRLVATIALTKNINIKDGSHILYFFNSPEKYIENALSFILTAKSLGQAVVFIDNEYHTNTVQHALLQYVDETEIQEWVTFINQEHFYGTKMDFQFEQVLRNFKNVVKPFLSKQIPVRVWGYIDWKEQPDIEEKLNSFECECDLTINEMGYITVCAYNGRKVPAYIQTEMMRNHEFIMTDTDLAPSSLYHKSEHLIYPSLSIQNSIESEMDFYKQKLDFIHVVAHEVRNPLTVIKSFATIIKSEIDNPDIKEKLSVIEDYSIAIDHEIHHIIQTEQMLTIDTFWKKTAIPVLPTIHDVLHVMDVKARTQNIKFDYTLQIDENVIINGNAMGFKLIISNLLSNAIKYSHEGESIYLHSYKDSEFLYIEVVDNGVGMSGDQLNRLFEKYQKTNQEIAGQGIGLYMVHKLVEHFHGVIHVTSELGLGTRIVVTFPYQLKI
ncbi:MEDS domain-containing protein [Alkalihalobacillus sp. LMS39]|uniref:MEDS domain-containing protein n=1 Tax=Alkalihalobacillus sp. LMS39 TaxID=2924032 RepID=UPI001FB4530A|nr:MEDS domain-containing protein [Alkalihalobacillus sp. LMS39]UOE94920.1 MEDS domain-containing protein [Alkalihalobacillus sp. LMS39]